MRNDIVIAGGIFTAKIKGVIQTFQNMRALNNYLAECCGVYCGDGCSKLVLPDQTNSKTQSLYFKGNKAYISVNGVEKELQTV